MGFSPATNSNLLYPDSLLRKSYDEMVELIPQVAAREILPRFGLVSAEYKSNGFGGREAFTAADIETSTALLTAARRSLPFSSSEEHLDLGRLTAPAYWLIDPIDGTDEFLAGNVEGYAVSAALMALCNGAYTPIAGIIYRPGTRSLWCADIDGKLSHTKDGAVAILPVPTRNQIRGSVRGVDPSEVARTAQLKIGSSLGLETSVQLGGGSAACFCDLLEDRINLSILNLNYSKEWDIAMAAPLIRARGGFLCDFEGRDFVWNRADPHNYRGYVASIAFRKEEILPHLSLELIENRLK